VSTFICKLCGRSYEGVFTPPLAFLPGDVEKRRAAWLAADEKLSKSPNNEHLERAYMKAWFSFGETLSSNVEQLPEGITTKPSKFGGGAYFVCSNPDGCKQTGLSVVGPPLREPAEKIPSHRCATCNAVVSDKRDEDHRRYTCLPGLHQPPA
jgi:hypothetical protein